MVSPKAAGGVVGGVVRSHAPPLIGVPMSPHVITTAGSPCGLIRDPTPFFVASVGLLVTGKPEGSSKW